MCEAPLNEISYPSTASADNAVYRVRQMEWSWLNHDTYKIEEVILPRVETFN